MRVKSKNVAYSKNFSGRLQKLVTLEGSEGALEAKAGTGHGTIAKAISRGGVLGADNLDKIRRATGVSLSWLVSGEEPMFAGPHEMPGVPTYHTGGGNHWVVSDDVQAYSTIIPANLVAFKVDGDSMEPIARDGQVVLAARDAAPRDGDLVVAEMNNGTSTFKRIFYRKTIVILSPVNPSHDPEVVSHKDIRRIMKVWGIKF